MLILVLSGTFAYLLYERPKRRREKEEKLVGYQDSYTRGRYTPPPLGNHRMESNRVEDASLSLDDAGGFYGEYGGRPRPPASRLTKV